MRDVNLWVSIQRLESGTPSHSWMTRSIVGEQEQVSNRSVVVTYMYSIFMSEQSR